MKKKSYVIKTVIFSILLSYLSMAPANALVPAKTQSETLWCWVAVQQSMLAHNSITATQCNIYKASKGTSTCPNNSGTMLDIQTGLNAYNVASSMYVDSMSWSSVKSYATMGHIVIWYWNGGSVGGADGHAVVGEGYQEVMTGGGYPINYLKYMDPGSGTHETILYTNAVGGSSYDRTWVGGLSNIYKRPF